MTGNNKALDQRQWREWRLEATQSPIDARTVGEYRVQFTEGPGNAWTALELIVGGRHAVLNRDQYLKLCDILVSICAASERQYHNGYTAAMKKVERDAARH